MQVAASGRTTYARFKSSMKKQLVARGPVASSPIVTRWQQLHAGGRAEEPSRACRAHHSTPGGAQPADTPGETPGQAKSYFHIQDGIMWVILWDDVSPCPMDKGCGVQQLQSV